MIQDMKFRLLITFGIPFGIALALQGILWWLFFQFPKEGTPLLLRFHVGFGADLFGSRSLLMTLPATAGVAWFVNAAVSIALRKKDIALARIVAWATVVVEGFFLLALFVLFWANRL